MAEPVKDRSLFCVEIEHKAQHWAVALYARITGRKIMVFGEQPAARMPGFLRRAIIYREDDIATRPGGRWYRIQRVMVRESRFLDSLDFGNDQLVRWLTRLFGSAKAVNFFRQRAADIEYKLLRDLALLKGGDRAPRFLFPDLKLYRCLAACHLPADQVVFSRGLALLHILAGMLVAVRKAFRFVFIQPVRRPTWKAKVLQRLARGFRVAEFPDDVLVDGEALKTDDLVFYVDGVTLKRNMKAAADEARQKGYRVLDPGHAFNVTRPLWLHLKNNVFKAAVGWMIAVFRSPSLIFMLGAFHDKAARAYQLYSFVDVEYQWSIGNWHDIVETIIANQCGIRMFMYHWSDNAQSYLYTTTHTVQNDLFLWGPAMEMQFPRAGHDAAYCIGSQFVNRAPGFSAGETRRKLGLSADHPVAVFYDSPPNDTMRFSRRQVDEFLHLLRDLARARPDVQMMLKAKSLNSRYDLFEGTAVKVTDCKGVALADLIEISTISVGMGIVAPPVVALMAGGSSIFYDTAGNFDTPLARYEGSLIFREKAAFLQAFHDALDGRHDFPDIPELAQYNVPGSDPIGILRDYVLSGRVPPEYRIEAVEERLRNAALVEAAVR